ncbi:MAG: hypothetical protein COA47_14395 [Robiginitomaculum sp.]|nr:MAG: hypothetical protein COA47_14395 [Robiginitomaculum sp.]
MVQLGEHFRTVDGRDRSDWERLQRQFAKTRVDHERREKLEDRLDDQLLAFAVEVVMATELQLQQFNARLDSYDEATVVALMNNQQQLDLVQARIAVLLDQAYIMDDGRRVFKTEDGTQVFDEFGQEVDAETLDPSQISAAHPTWEKYSSNLREQTQLLAQRQEILEFQERLDEARDQTADGQISEAELDTLDAELLDMMPPSVREQVPGMEVPTSTPELSAVFAKPAAPAQVQSTEVSPMTPTLSH